MNLKIKFRESFRPFAPSVLVDRVSDYFDLDRESPYMLLVAPVREDRRQRDDRTAFNAGDEDMLAVVRQARSDIPAITHVDYSARIQTIHPDDKPDYHAVIDAFERLTGYGVIVNTSFNVRGEPIVCTPQDAYRCFMRSEIDMLVLEDCVLEKANQPSLEHDDSWKKEFELD
jgi:carbamoyltransferase